MSEFGSSKSFSSVSESSASHSSQPPDSSSSHSSGGPSSSSDEVHTCHRCGNCCFSNKSKIKFEKPPLPPELAGDPWSVFLWDSLPDTIPFTGVEEDGGSESIVWGPVYSDVRTENEGEVNEVSHRLRLTVRRGCALIYSPFQLAVETQQLFGPNPDDDDHWDVVSLFFALEGPSTDTCCWTKQESQNWFDTYFINDPVTVEIENNPCCWDTIGVGCFQHFGGDCRGNCDEAPSPGSSASSSEENPFP